MNYRAWGHIVHKILACRFCVAFRKGCHEVVRATISETFAESLRYSQNSNSLAFSQNEVALIYDSGAQALGLKPGCPSTNRVGATPTPISFAGNATGSVARALYYQRTRRTDGH